MPVLFPVMLLLVVAVIIIAITTRRLAELILTIVGLGGAISLLSGINMMKDADIAGSILIGIGIFALLGVAIAVKLFERHDSQP